MQNKAIISLGSNIDPGKNIPEAKLRIAEITQVLSESRFVQTKPLGIVSQPDFINGALLVETDWTMEELALQLKKIEKDMGRIRTQDKFGPRTIDLDVVVWNGVVVDEDVRRRAYLAESISKIWPEGINKQL